VSHRWYEPALFVRELSPAERQQLQAGLRSPEAFVLRRCQILLASARGEHAPKIAVALGCNRQTVIDAIHDFNQNGLAALVPGGAARLDARLADPDPARVRRYGLEEARDARRGDGPPMKPRDDWDAALFAAASDGDLAKASNSLAAGANVNAVNPHNLTPLLEASGQGHLEMTRYLIGQGAEIDYTGMREGSPLMLAAYMGQLEFLRLFLEAGANANLAMPNGGETALHMAAVTGRTAAAKMLLDAGADPNRHAQSGVATDMFDGNVKLWGETPLHYAAAYGDEEMIQAMLSAGANKVAPNTHGETPLEYAGRHRRPRSIRDLLK
jgi:ankyrin repeat protein